MVVTMQDVARRAGVALSTVSATLTSARPVSAATRARVQAAMDEAMLRESPKIEKRTGYLAMLSNAAMLFGLLGTISGLINCFAAVANVNPADKATILSLGISEAMNCTGFGLIVAIPSLLAFAALQGRTQHMMDDINESTVGLLNLIVANKDKMKIPANFEVAED